MIRHQHDNRRRPDREEVVERLHRQDRLDLTSWTRPGVLHLALECVADATQFAGLMGISPEHAVREEE